MALSGIGDEGQAGRRSVDSDVNMVPMIDLMICCIAFLMLTAAWSTLSRLETNAAVPGGSSCGDGCKKEENESLHVEMREADRFKLTWKLGSAVVKSVEVPRHAAEAGARYPELSAAVGAEWAALSARGAAPKGPVQAVVHCDHATPFREMAAVMDSVLSPRRAYPGAPREMPAFQVTLAQN